MSEATIAHWEVTRAKNAGQKPNPHGGQLDKWYVGLKNLDGGTDCEDAYWQRKNPSEVSVGDQVYGKIEEGDYGFRFYLEKDEDGQRPRSSETSTSNNSKPASSGGETNWTERNAEIRRQHSQEMSLRVMAIVGWPAKGTSDILRDVAVLADEFDQDAVAAGQKASQGAGASVGGDHSPGSSSPPRPSAPPPEQSPVDFTGARKEEPGLLSVNFHKSELPNQDLDDYRQLLSNAGLEPAAARDKAAEYLCLVLPEDRLNKAVSGLQDLDRQGTVLAQLKAETEQWIGGPLPQGDALDGDESIPF